MNTPFQTPVHIDSGMHGFYLCGNDHELIVLLDSATSEEAEEIMKRINAYDELVEFAEKVRDNADISGATLAAMAGRVLEKLK